MSDGSGASAWNYDPIGRVASLRRSINSNANTATYTYSPNVNGEVANLTYFSGSQIAYTWRGADRSLTAIDPYPINFVKNATYFPAGALTGAVLGAYNTGFTGTAITNSYNNRLQSSLWFSDAIRENTDAVHYLNTEGKRYWSTLTARL
jgi:hypothetical protein